MAEDNRYIEPEFKRKKEQETEKLPGRKGYLVSFIIFSFAFISIIYVYWSPYSGDRLYDKKATDTAKDFFDQTMAYFADTKARSVTSDGPPGFNKDHNVTITGGPMNWDGTNMVLIKPLIFRHKNSSNSVIFNIGKAQATVLSEVVKEYEIAEIERLYLLKEKRNVDGFVVATKDKSPIVRRYAVQMLSEFNGVLDPLIEALNDKDRFVRISAASALGVKKDKRAIEPLIVALKDDIINVQEEAARSLNKITNEDFGRNPEKWQEWWNKNK